MAWVQENYQYKIALLATLSPFQQRKFLLLFFHNRECALYILYRKMNGLLDLSLEFLSKCCTLPTWKKYLAKINSVKNALHISNMEKTFNRVQANYHNVSIHNVKDILQFVEQERLFCTKQIPISWGPGNHKNSEINIQRHYEKHVLDPVEGVFWHSILQPANRDTYAAYAINAFYKMKRVIVHSNGRYVYLSGFVDKVFIVGRFDDQKFGISSCYYVSEGEKKGRWNDICFEINFFD